ncbi:MAG: methyltransferase domain-containing protein [Acidimicrobiia bacterium]|nr:methyltransferase domain-containing protein [Acidimicrobiia bacterium]
MTPLLGTDVLEVEAGSGELTQRIAAGRRVTALEASKHHVESLTVRFRQNPDVTVRHAHLLDVAERGQFDSVLLVNVVEHSDDDHEVLKAARAVLRPGGRLIVFAGAFAGLSGKLDRRGQRGHRYRRSELVERADRAGLTVVEARYVNAPGAVLAWVLARLPGGGGERTGALVRAYDRLLVPALRRWDQRGEPGFGESLLLVAQRPD